MFYKSGMMSSVDNVAVDVWGYCRSLVGSSSPWTSIEVHKSSSRWTPSLAQAGVGACLVTGVTALYYQRDWLGGTLSRLVSWTRESLRSPVLQLFSSSVQPDNRALLRRIIPISERPATNHSHGKAAGTRSVGNDIIAKFSLLLGQPTFSLSGDKSEVKFGSGSRNFYTAKDLQSNWRRERIPGHCLLKLTDVDYYVDMPTLLNGRDAIILTWAPKRPAGEYERSCYSTTGDVVTMTVNGGAIYQHQLWDYDSDCFIVDHWWGSAVYLTERRELADDRAVIYFNCIRRVYGPFAWTLPGVRLQRRKFSKGAYCYSQYLAETGGVMHSFSLFGSTTTADVSDEVFTSIRIRYASSKDPKLSDVERILRSSEHPKPVAASAILYFALSCDPLATFPLVARRDGHTYQTLEPLVLEDGKPSMHQIHIKRHGIDFQPLGTAFAPARSLNNDTACVAGRIEGPRNPNYPLPARYYRYLEEFVGIAVPDHIAGTLVPEDFSTAYERLTRPAQRSKLNMVEQTLFCSHLKIKAFQKAEAYPKICPPRNIATVPMDFNFRHGQYVSEFANHVLKPAHWYAFGKHPSKTTRQLRRKAEESLRFGSGCVVDTDGSAWDFSQHAIMRELDQRLMHRSFHRDYHHELIEIYDSITKARGITKEQVRYVNGSATITGGADTSARNSCGNAFTHYIVLREMGMNPVLAYTHLGLYGGDDGLTFNVDTAIVERVWATLGMVVKCHKIYPGQPTPFLGRIYPDIWTTDASMADVGRQLRKFHLTTCPPIVDGELVLKRKAEAFLITDPETPLLSELCRLILRVTKCSDRELARYEKFLRLDMPYWSRFESSPFTPPEADAAFALVAENLQIETADLTRIIHKINLMKSLKELCELGPQFLEEAEVHIPAVVNAVVLRPDKKRPTFREQQTALRTKTGLPAVPLCRATERGKRCTRENCQFSHELVRRGPNKKHK